MICIEKNKTNKRTSDEQGQTKKASHTAHGDKINEKNRMKQLDEYCSSSYSLFYYLIVHPIYFFS